MTDQSPETGQERPDECRRAYWCRRAQAFTPETDTLADLLGRAGDEELIQVISRAIEDAQLGGRVEYRRRVGRQGRQTMAETILWRLRESVSPPGETP